MNPTPTAAPSTQFVQQVGNIIESSVQQGIVGVLLFVSLTCALLAFGFVLYQYRQRNAKPKESAESILGPLAGLLDQSLSANRDANKESKQRDEEHRRELKERDEIHKSEIKEITERAVGAEVRSAAAMEAMVGIQTTSSGDLSLLKTAVTKMTEVTTQMHDVGSLPMQAVVQAVVRIEGKLDQEWQTTAEDRVLKENILQELALVNAILVRIEQKRKTDELAKVTEPNSDAVPSIN